MKLCIGNGAVLKSSSQWQLKRILKINSSWTELFNFQNCEFKVPIAAN